MGDQASAQGGKAGAEVSVQWGDERLPPRFWDKVVPEPMSGCWLWVAYVSKNGYGKVGIGGKVYVAHVVAYERLVCHKDTGMDLDHLCRVRCCVNPAHLEQVTRLENARRGEGGKHNARKTHCAAGHPYDDGNTRHGVTPRGTPARWCRACGTYKAREARPERNGWSEIAGDCNGE